MCRATYSRCNSSHCCIPTDILVFIVSKSNDLCMSCAVRSARHDHTSLIYVCADRQLETGEAEMADMASQIQELEQRKVQLEAEAADKASDIAALQTEKDIQQGGEVRELQQSVDDFAKR